MFSCKTFFLWSLWWPEVGVSVVRVAVLAAEVLPQELPIQGHQLQLCREFLGAPCLLNPTQLTEAMETTNFNSASDMPYLWFPLPGQELLPQHDGAEMQGSQIVRCF